MTLNDTQKAALRHLLLQSIAPAQHTHNLKIQAQTNEYAHIRASASDHLLALKQVSEELQVNLGIGNW